MVIELEVPSFLPHRLRIVEVGEDQTWGEAVWQPDILRREDRGREVAVPTNELVLLRIAVQEGSLSQCSREQSDLARRESVLRVEEERLPNQACRSPAGPLNSCRMKL